MWKHLSIEWNGPNFWPSEYACMQMIVKNVEAIENGTYESSVYCSVQDYLNRLQKNQLIKNWQLTIVSVDRYDIKVEWEHNWVTIIYGWQQKDNQVVTLNDIKF